MWSYRVMLHVKRHWIVHFNEITAIPKFFPKFSSPVAQSQLWRRKGHVPQNATWLSPLLAVKTNRLQLATGFAKGHCKTLNGPAQVSDENSLAHPKIGNFRSGTGPSSLQNVCFLWMPAVKDYNANSPDWKRPYPHITSSRWNITPSLWLCHLVGQGPGVLTWSRNTLHLDHK